jgi:hypothetical protein
MSNFSEKMHLKGKVEEDLYFAKLNAKLIAVLHEKIRQEKAQEIDKLNKQNSKEGDPTKMSE